MVPDEEDEEGDSGDKSSRRKSQMMMQNRLESITSMRRSALQVRLTTEDQVQEAKTVEALQQVESGKNRFMSALVSAFLTLTLTLTGIVYY